jgi:ATP-dependent Clp protease ATP-binding subunit ClpB
MVRLSQNLDATKVGPEAAKLKADLYRLIIGQDEAVNQVAASYQTFLTGMTNPKRPICNLMLLGPTGSGKTRLVEAVAESLLGEARGVVKIDCAEFQHSHEIAKLIGSPPGYVGHRETHGLLSQETLNQFHTDRVKLSFVLFDEIEKASDALWNLLLGILDKATLTLGDNRRVDFSSAMIFMTSNLGAPEMSSILNPGLGFTALKTERMHLSAGLDEKVAAKLTRAGADAARRKFTPEFMNRIDRLMVFKPLGTVELRKILELELKLLQQRILRSASGTPFIFSVTQAASAHLLREGTDVRYGARHLKRAIEQLLVQAISNLVASDQVRAGDSIQVDFDPVLGCMTFQKEMENVRPEVMLRMADAGLSPESSPMARGLVVKIPRAANARL